ncbi:MAG: T9SS type A sorting domain-containing protein [Bacteroidales bacterium]
MSSNIAEISLKIRIPSWDPDMVLYQTVKVVTNTVGPDTVIYTDDLPFLCTPSMPNLPGYSRMSVVYADKSLRRLTKPVVFVEGFETSLEDYGDISYQNFVNGLISDKGFPEFGEMPVIFDTLLANGFDLVYVDFKDSRDTIEKGVLAVIKAIQWVNADLLQSGSREKIIVTGASLGGLMARYALRQMEMDGCCHNTQLYISFDAPHRGANIPVGMQKLVEVAASESAAWKSVAWPLSWIIKFKDLEVDLSDPDVEESWARVLNSPAARTLLIQHLDPTALTEHQKFYAYLDSIGLPNYCRNIALISGSENAYPLMLDDPAQRLLGTGRVLDMPHSWRILVPPFNSTTISEWFPLNIVQYPVAFSQAYAESQPIYFEHNDWDLSIHNMNKIILTAGWHSLLNSGLGIASMAFTATNPLASAFLEASIMVNKAEGNGMLQTLHAQSAGISSYPSGALQNLTCAPGGLNNSIKKLGGAADGMIEVFSSEFSFIPSVSALDVEGLGLLPDLKYRYLLDARALTSFDAYWAPKRHETGDSRQNQLHVEVGPWNRQWIREHILLEYDLKGNDGSYGGALASTYNFGKPGLYFDINHHNLPHHTVLYSLNVMAGASLYVNRYGEIGFPGGNDMTQQASNFHLSTSGDSCDPTYVRIQTGAEMILGDPLNGNTAQVIFRPNTTLELFPGSMLRISANSRLLMEKGSTLVIHPGAQIILDGQESVLEMCGKLELKDQAVMSWSGSGYLKYNAQMTAADHGDFFSLGAHSGLNAAGVSNTDRKLVIAAETWFPYNLEIEIEDAMVTIGENVNLHFYGPVNAGNAWFCADDTSTFYGAVTVYGQSSMNIVNCTFSHASVGLKALLGLGGSDLKLHSCLFRNNITGLYSSDERVALTDCRLVHNAQHGWFAENMAGKSMVEDSHIMHNGHAGIVFDGQLSASILVRNSHLSSNFIGVEIHHAMLQAQCSYFSDNIYAGILGGPLAQLDLSGISRNQISDNYIGILLDKALVINLENGFAKFSGNQFYVIGEVLPNQYYTLATNTIKTLIFSGNHMPWIGNLLPVNIYLTHPLTQAICQVGIIANIQVSPLQTTCNSAVMDNDHIVKPLQVLSGTSVISAGRFNNYLLLDALSIAAGLVSCDGYAGNDTLAIACFADILANSPLLLNEDEKSAVDYSLMLLSSALSNAIEKGDIDPNRALDGMPVNEYVELITARVQEQLNTVDPSGFFAGELEARYALMMAQMYRVAEHYDYALNILQDYPHFSNTSLENAANYWSCVCVAERLLLLDSIDRDHFFAMMDSCNSTCNARLAPFVPLLGYFSGNQEDEEPLVVRKVYPNPADHHFVIELNLPAKMLAVEISDVTGKKVVEIQEEYAGTSITVRLPAMSPGIYYARVIADGFISMHKLTVNQQ